MDDLDDTLGTAENDPNDDGNPRQGLLWVRKHNHEFVAGGDEPRPPGPGIVLRRYFVDLEEAISAWGRFGSARWKIDKSLELLRRVEEAETSTFRECFFVFEQGVPGDYLAIVLGQSRSGRLWLRKTAIHSAVNVEETVQTDAMNKKFFEHKFADYRGRETGHIAGASKRPVCQFTFLVVPFSGICECGYADCEYSDA